MRLDFPAIAVLVTIAAGIWDAVATRKQRTVLRERGRAGQSPTSEQEQ